MKAPSKETGTVRSGISVARTFWRKMKTTMMTRMRASNRVWMISSMEAVTAGVVS